MFAEDPGARSDVKAGTLYAVWGIGDWIYYGQVSPNKSVGFFARRDRDIAATADVLTSPIMSRVMVAFPSIGRALRSGAWKKLGRHMLRAELASANSVVQWPLATTEATVWTGSVQDRVTGIDDPSIQELEVMAVWDAIEHIPGRLALDYAPNEISAVPKAWSIGGPVWRERRLREEFARRFPGHPIHALPPDWVPVEDRLKLPRD